MVWVLVETVGEGIRRLGEENGLLMIKISVSKVCKFSNNRFYKNINCIVLVLSFGSGWG